MMLRKDGAPGTLNLIMCGMRPGAAGNWPLYQVE